LKNKISVTILISVCKSFNRFQDRFARAKKKKYIMSLKYSDIVSCLARNCWVFGDPNFCPHFYDIIDINILIIIKFVKNKFIQIMANCILLTENEESQHTNNTYYIVIASDYLFPISNNYKASARRCCLIATTISLLLIICLFFFTCFVKVGIYIFNVLYTEILIWNLFCLAKKTFWTNWCVFWSVCLVKFQNHL